MKALLEQDLATAVAVLKANGVLPDDATPDIRIARTRDVAHGDFATNVAMQLAKAAGRPPRALADELVRALPDRPEVREVRVEGPGFINFFQAQRAAVTAIADVLEQGARFGRSDIGQGHRVTLEFVSANPTGPLHVGHGRGAALGGSLAALLAAAGFEVQSEYYVNDAGRQMDILAVSVWLRYLEARDVAVAFPSNGYRGDYIRDIARELAEREGDALVRSSSEVFDAVPPDEPAGGDRESHVDGLVQRARALLGDGYRRVFDLALETVLSDIRADLAEFGVEFDQWFRESCLTDRIPDVVARLEAAGHLYEKDGATWFRSTDFGDNKDRVVVRENGQSTYFASDIAYVDDKIQRGYERLLYVFGADHHGYTARVLAACEALGHDRTRVEFLLIQFAVLYRAGEQVQMSTRSGSFVTLRELRDEVGRDAARFFYVMRKHTQHMDFDLDLAKSESTDNPVYYVQYAHARICSVFRQCEQRGIAFDRERGLGSLDRLTEAGEARLVALMAGWRERIESAATAREPHQLTNHLRELANALHTYYNAHRILVEDDALRDARLCLLAATRQVLVNGLGLIGVSTPEVM